MMRKFSPKTIETSTPREGRSIYAELCRLHKNVHKSRPHLDPTFCSCCLKSSRPLEGVPAEKSECCQHDLITKAETLKILDELINLSAKKVRADGKAGFTSKRSRRRRKGSKRVRAPEGPVTLILNEKEYSFTSRKKARKFLRDHGTSIRNYTTNSEGKLIPRSG